MTFSDQKKSYCKKIKYEKLSLELKDLRKHTITVKSAENDLGKDLD